MRKTLLTLVSIVAVVALVSGCAKPPQADIDSAKQALDMAAQAEAPKYAAAEFNTAKGSLDAAMAEVEKQNGKFILFRNYGEAKKQLATALTDAGTAKSTSDTNKEMIRQEANNLLGQAQAALTEAKGLMEKAPKGKEGKAALEAISADLTAVEASLGQVTTSLNGGDFMGARDTAKAALDKVSAVKAELEAAIAKKAGKKK
jgi:hypothetical protein